MRDRSRVAGVSGAAQSVGRVDGKQLKALENLPPPAQAVYVLRRIEMKHFDIQRSSRTQAADNRLDRVLPVHDQGVGVDASAAPIRTQSRHDLHFSSGCC